MWWGKCGMACWKVKGKACRWNLRTLELGSSDCIDEQVHIRSVESCQSAPSLVENFSCFLIHFFMMVMLDSWEKSEKWSWQWDRATPSDGIQEFSTSSVSFHLFYLCTFHSWNFEVLCFSFIILTFTAPVSFNIERRWSRMEIGSQSCVVKVLFFEEWAWAVICICICA